MSGIATETHLAPTGFSVPKTSLTRDVRDYFAEFKISASAVSTATFALRVSLHCEGVPDFCPHNKGHQFLSVQNGSRNECGPSHPAPASSTTDLRRPQEQLHLKASSIFSRFSKTPKIICANCVGVLGGEGHLSTKSCTTTGLLKIVLEKYFMSNTTQALRACTKNDTYNENIIRSLTHLPDKLRHSSCLELEHKMQQKSHSHTAQLEMRCCI